MIGIQPYYFRASYTFACPSLGYTAISGLYIPHIATLMRHSGVYNPVISGFYTPDTGIFSSLKCWRHLSRNYQLTESSCFHDDRASPQA